MFNWWFGKKRAKGDQTGPFRQPGRELTAEEKEELQAKPFTALTRAAKTRAKALASQDSKHAERLKNLLAGIEREAALGKLELMTTIEHTPKMVAALRAEGFTVEKRWPAADKDAPMFALNIKW